MNRAVTDVEQVSLDTMVLCLSDICTRVRLPDHAAVVSSFLRNLYTVLHIVVLTCIPKAEQSLLELGTFLFYDNHSSRSKAITLCDFDLHHPDS